jgi:hypothetical protein
LLVVAVLAIVVGSGLLHAFGEAPPTTSGVPLATSSDVLDTSTWTTPLASLSLVRLHDGRHRPGLLLAVSQAHADGSLLDTAGATAAIIALALLRLLTRREHGVRAPPLA